MSDTLTDANQPESSDSGVTFYIHCDNNPELGLSSELVQTLIDNCGNLVKVVYSLDLK